MNRPRWRRAPGGPSSRARPGRLGVQKRSRSSPRVAPALLASALVPIALASPRGVPTQPTPRGPISAGVPGALPAGFRYRYNALSSGWPVRPRSVQHPIRGAFIDPRGTDDNGLSGYHFGVDINVDDRHPERGAPAGLSHAVYALDAGTVRAPRNVGSRRCVNRRLDVGHFSYWHVSPVVANGARVNPGQLIAWTCRGVWHVHLSEWQVYRGRRVWVNPLHRGGPLTPYVDTAAPVVSQLRLVSAPSRPWRPVKSLAEPDNAVLLQPTNVHGRVEVRAEIADPQSFLGFLADMPAWPTRWTPYRVRVQIRNVRSGRLVLDRVSFQADQLPQTPYLVHYAPGTVEDDNMQECVGPPALPRCDGVTWLRPFSRFRQEYWNANAVANGPYRVTVRVWDIAGNSGSRSLVVTVRH